MSSAASASDLYNLDFTAPEAGTYEVRFGTPTVQPSVGPFQDALVFDAVATYEQIRFPISTPTAVPGYKVECDVFTHNLRDSNYGFAIFLDTPQVRTLEFSGNRNIIYPSFPDTIELIDDQVYHIEIVVNMQANTWKIAVGGEQTFSFAFDAAQVSSVRFSLAPNIGGVGDAPGTYVALDNVHISVVPEPPVWTLLLLAAFPAWFLRRRISHRPA